MLKEKFPRGSEKKKFFGHGLREMDFVDPNLTKFLTLRGICRHWLAKFVQSNRCIIDSICYSGSITCQIPNICYTCMSFVDTYQRL
jgi:hypothetical protein